jgi:hypothetical protein
VFSVEWTNLVIGVPALAAVITAIVVAVKRNRRRRRSA